MTISNLTPSLYNLEVFKGVGLPVGNPQAQNQIIFLRKNDIDKLTHVDALVVMAHPDDETLFGFIAGLIQSGQIVQLVYATSGDQGQDKQGILHKGKELAEKRENELAEALAKLGVSQPTILLNFKDGDISLPQNKEHLSQCVNKIVEKTSPNVVYSFGEDGVSGHPDHITIGEISKNSVSAYNKSHWYGPRTRFYQTGFLPDSVKKFKNSMKNTNAWDDMQAVSAVSLKVNIKPEISTVVNAVASHKTQFNQDEINGFYSYFNAYPYVELKEVVGN